MTSKKLGAEEVKLALEVLQKADDKLLREINSNVDRFIGTVSTRASEKGIKWDDILLAFEWSFEADIIKIFL
jgi:hypothetical protein